jgi:photosystem II stability/assembly factor-like uncharacterized protein
MTVSHGEYRFKRAGLWQQAEGDVEWQDITPGLPANPYVRAILVHPQYPAIVYSGTKEGVYRSDDRGNHWEALDTAKNLVCALAFHPKNPNIMFAGFEPIGISRSDDGGETWRQINLDGVRFPHITNYMPPTEKRVTQFAIDPTNPMEMYASIEIGGLLASKDGGENWDQKMDGPFLGNRTIDLHSCAVTTAAPGTVFTTCALGMFRSRDRGNHWEHVLIKEMFPLVMDNSEKPGGGAYCRGMLVDPNEPKTIYATNNRGGGAAPKGTVSLGAVFRSRDTGETWEWIDIGEPTTRLSHIAIDRAAPSNIYLGAGEGYVYSSHDGGKVFSRSQVPNEILYEPNRYVIGLGAG